MRVLPAVLCVLLAPLAFAGPLNPPAGPITSTPGPEPRIAINATNTPSSGTALFRIGQSGSYYLTGNITGVSGKAGIEIIASDVTIDLNGFELLGVAGSGSGILAASTGITGITITNGSVRGWGSGGIALASGAVVLSEIRALNNTGAGITSGTGTTISNCTARGNTGAGINCGERSTVFNTTSSANSIHGFVSSNACTFSNCTADSNTGNGFNVAFFCTISSCVASRNATGISTASSCTITDCAVAENTADGISVAYQCIVRGNAASLNVNAGIRATQSRNRIERNNCTGNLVSPTAIGIQVAGPGNLIVGNSCSTNAAGNYSIAAGNRYGPIIDLTAPGAAAASGNSAPSTLTSSDANANYAY